MELLGQDKLQIVSSATLGSDDYHSLTLLYQPLIGKEAFTLYLLFNSFLERSSLTSKEFDHLTICSYLNLTVEEFYQARIKLEAIDLLTTYFKDEAYIYLIKVPLSSKQFLKDGALGIYLFTKIGEQQFNRLVDFFKITTINKNGLQNISKNFDEVFTSNFNTVPFEIEEYLVGRKPNKSIKVSVHHFNFDVFTGKVPNHLIDRRTITKKFTNSIINLSYIYGFDEDIMVLLYKKTLENKGSFDLTTMSKFAKEHYALLNNATPAIETVTNTSFDEQYQMIKNMTAKEIINVVSGNIPTAIQLGDIEKHYTDSSLDRSVLNCMLMFILNKNPGKFLSYNYFKKVENGWIEKGILTYERAIEYLCEDYNRPSKAVYKKKSEPSWISEYVGNVNEGVKEL